MAKKRKPEDLVELKIRLPEEFRLRLEQDAKKNNRSVNGEMVHRIGMTYGPEGHALARRYDEAQKEVMQKFHEMMDQMLAKKGD